MITLRELLAKVLTKTAFAMLRLALMLVDDITVDGKPAPEAKIRLLNAINFILGAK